MNEEFLTFTAEQCRHLFVQEVSHTTVAPCPCKICVLERRCAELKAENAALRAKLSTEPYVLLDAMNDLNAKLRAALPSAAFLKRCASALGYGGYPEPADVLLRRASAIEAIEEERVKP